MKYFVTIYFTSTLGVLIDANKTEIIYCIPSSKVKLFVVPGKVKAIKAYALHSCRNMREVIIHDSIIEEIGVGTFADCVNLRRIILPPSIKKNDCRRSIWWLQVAKVQTCRHREGTGWTSRECCNKSQCSCFLPYQFKWKLWRIFMQAKRKMRQFVKKHSCFFLEHTSKQCCIALTLNFFSFLRCFWIGFPCFVKSVNYFSRVIFKVVESD